MKNKMVVNEKTMPEVGLLVILLVILYALTACSFKLEFGYHGETGRDDRTQTQAKK